MDSKEIPGRKEVGYAVGAGTLLVTDELNGGELGGLVRVRDQILDPARMQIGLLSQGLSFTFNAQHRQGISLNNQTNLDYFTDITVATAAPRSDNTGTAQFQSTVTNPAALVASDYRLSYSLAGGYELTRLSVQQSHLFRRREPPAAGTLPDGFDISLTAGAIADGDSFMIRPVYGAGSDLGLAITDGRDIAAAGMLRGETPTTNQGTGTISQPVVNGAVAPPNDILPLAQIKLTYDGALNRFNVSGPAPAGGTNFAYVAGATQTLYGFDIVINGAPQNGDYFIVSGGTSDNRNILALADLQTANTLLAGRHHRRRHRQLPGNHGQSGGGRGLPDPPGGGRPQCPTGLARHQSGRPQDRKRRQPGRGSLQPGALPAGLPGGGQGHHRRPNRV